MEGIIYLLLVIVFVVGIALLQIYLSKIENKRLGLILPMVSFVLSILAILRYVVYENKSTTEYTFQSFMLFLSTISLLAIYFASSKKFKKKKGLDIMKIEDLE